MSKITNDGLTRFGTGCFIAVPIWQHGVKWLTILLHCWEHVISSFHCCTCPCTCRRHYVLLGCWLLFVRPGQPRWLGPSATLALWHMQYIIPTMLLFDRILQYLPGWLSTTRHHKPSPNHGVEILGCLSIEGLAGSIMFLFYVRYQYEIWCIM